MPRGALGLNRGALASASISPVLGSIITAMPAVGLGVVHRLLERLLGDVLQLAIDGEGERGALAETGVLDAVGEQLAALGVAQAFARDEVARELVFEAFSSPSRPCASVPTRPMTCAATSRCG